MKPTEPPDHTTDADQLARQARDMERVVADLRRQLSDERSTGPIDKESLEAALADASVAHDALLRSVESLKEVASQRKHEIDGWNAWFAARTAEDVEAAAATMQYEVSWRLQEIQSVEDEIQSTMIDELRARGTVEELKARIAAWDAGVLDGPIDADPRLVTAEASLEELRRQLARVTPARTPSGRQPVFELYAARGGGFGFNLKAPNGEVVLASEHYRSGAGARNGIESVRRNAGEPTRFEQRDAADGRPYFVLKAVNGEVIGVSQTYASARGASRGMEAVARYAARARLDDVT